MAKYQYIPIEETERERYRFQVEVVQEADGRTYTYIRSV